MTAADVGWAVARDAHFEVYSQAGTEQAASALHSFESLRGFFATNGMPGVHAGAVESGTPIRVVGFGSKQDYDAYRLRDSADAYYVGRPDRDYIVMPGLGAHEFNVAAHEYAHLVLHAHGLKLPSWLNEGLAEVFSTLTITREKAEFGGVPRGRLEALQRRPWIPAREFFDGPAASGARHDTSKGMFYAESWAVVDMLISSPEYQPRIGALLKRLNAGESNSSRELSATYTKTAEQILEDARRWIVEAQSRRRVFPAPTRELATVVVEAVPTWRSQLMIADLLLTIGDLDRAQTKLEELLRWAPETAEVTAELGNVHLQRGEKQQAVALWQRAMDSGLQNASLCYRYAGLAEDLAMPPAQIEHALELAIRQQPDFDDARYKLGLMESNAGEYRKAVDQLKAMQVPTGDRAFEYWSALSYALERLDERDEAVRAGEKAASVARTPDERARAKQLIYISKTELAVRFEAGADGAAHLVTTRVPHGTTAFNPFVIPGDDIQTAQGKLREVSCRDNQLTGFQIQTASGMLSLNVADPTRVLMRNSPTEFNCGLQQARAVRVEYAAGAAANSGALRSMEFLAQQ